MPIFLRSTDGNPDSRLQKYIDSLSCNGILYHSLCWNRCLKYEDDLSYTYYHQEATYGSGIKNARKLLGFNFFLLKQLIKKRKTYKVIHACDFDTILPAIFMKLFFRKKVIYDIFDWFVDSRELHNIFIKKSILFLEYINLKYSDITIICEEERKEQIRFQTQKLWILPNIPNFKVKCKEEVLKNNDKIILSYVGVLTKHRGIEKILECAKLMSDRLELNIAGFGELEQMVVSYSKNSSNIHFYGTVAYEKGIRIMTQSDIILALYEKTIPNHIYAAPNKYYEGLYLGKPILTTQGTFVGAKTEKYKTGFAVDENIESLKHFFIQEGLEEQITIYADNAKKMWKNKYYNYVETFMMEKYIPYLRINELV